MKRLDLEFKVGIFVAMGIAILIAMIFSLNELKYSLQKYTLKLQFDFANGIEISAPVRLAGVQVGEVKDIRLAIDKERNKTVVELMITLDKNARIEEDAEAFINTLAIIGEKYVEIVPGTPGKRTLKRGDPPLKGKDTVPIEKLTEKGYEVATGLGDTIKYLNRMIGDEQVQEAFKATIIDLRKLVGSANVVMDKVKSGEGTVGKLFMDDKLYKELEDFIRDLKAHPWKLLQKPRGAK